MIIRQLYFFIVSINGQQTYFQDCIFYCYCCKDDKCHKFTTTQITDMKDKLISILCIVKDLQYYKQQKYNKYNLSVFLTNYCNMQYAD